MKILFLGTEADKPFLSYLRQYCQSYSLVHYEFLSEIASIFKPGGTTHIITTQPHLIAKLCATASDRAQTLDNYAGSWATDKANDLEYLFIHPLMHFVSVSYGEFLQRRYISKFTAPNKWITVDDFTWKLLETPNDYAQCLATIECATLCAIDIETRPDLSISSVSYTTIHKQGNKGRLITQTMVMPLPLGLPVDDYEIRFAWLGRFNATETPKIFQNGKYDCAYFQRYSIPVTAYYYDTQNCHHAYYSELPKALDTLAVFYIKQTTFWKHEGSSGNEYDLYRYNALDTWHTAWVFLAWIAEAPNWARDNYLLSYQTIMPNFVCESTGLAVDYERFYPIAEKQIAAKSNALREIQASVGNWNYNPGSPTQNMRLLKILGCDKIKNADKKVMDRVKHNHPFLELLIDTILEYKKAEKMVGTYLNETKHFNGRILYSLSATTDTSRAKSKSHHFWTGFNIQNIPTTGGIRSYIVPDPGFAFGEADYSKAESWDTGYITGDKNLIAKVSDTTKDFHTANASDFFGMLYEEIDKALRQYGKKINHGASYMMAGETLIDSMGLTNVYGAATRLALPKTWSAKKIADYLLGLFAKTYPTVAHDYPKWIFYQVKQYRKLTNPYGWTRYCFAPLTDKGFKNKAHLRALVAHQPQSTNAQSLGKASSLIFNNVWKEHHENFKMCAFVHDSILFQYRIGYEWLGDLVVKAMEEASTVEVTDISGIKRVLTVPVDLKMEMLTWQDAKD